MNPLNPQKILADRLQQQGINQAEQQNLETAIRFWQDAAILYQDISDLQGINNSLANSGLAHHFLGNYQQAINYHQRSLELNQSNLNHDQDEAMSYRFGEYTALRQLGSRRSLGYSLFNLGFSYYWQNAYSQAIDAYLSSLALTQDIGDRQNEVLVLAQLGEVYFYAANYSQSISYHQQAVEIAVEVGDRSSQGNSLNSLGNAHIKLADWAKARDYYTRALQIWWNENNLNGQGNTIAGIGIAYSNEGRHQQAIEQFQQSLSLFEQMDDQYGGLYNQGRALNLLGRAYYFLGEDQHAIEYQLKSLKISQTLSERFSEQLTRSDLGLSLFRLGRFAEAEVHLRASIEILDSIRYKLGNQDELKISVFDRHPEPYQLLQLVLVSQNKTAEALEIAERGRARAFAERLFQGQATSDQLSAMPRIEQLQAIAGEQHCTFVEYSLIQVQGLEVPALLIWVIKATGQIEFREVSLALQYTSLSDLIAQARARLGIKDALVRDVSSIGIQIFQAAQYDTEPLCQLYQYLIAPIQKLLPSNADESVVFIPQGELFLVPFAALQNSTSRKYLIEQHPILTAPSIQVVGLTRSHAPQSALLNPLIVGNPIMPTLAATADCDAKFLKPLPAAELEAITIAALFDSTAVIGKAATKAEILNRCRLATVIHLGTHALLDSLQQDSTPGAIALCPTEYDDGFLTADEILDRFAPPQGTQLVAKLAVLSACSTGLGKITGDGVVGLARCLLAAGLSSVVVSIWSVHDLSTTFLMIRFYQELVRGSTVVQALRTAQVWLQQVQKHELKQWIDTLPLEVSQKRQLRMVLRSVSETEAPFASPYYWAAFSMIGQNQTRIVPSVKS
jgi:CHAT domain-containing protein/tetratricopeptide (TPR) repeat protein